MLSYFGMLNFLRSPEERKKEKKREEERIEGLMEEAVSWDPKMKWREQIVIKADTYPVPSLFEVKPIDGYNINQKKNDDQIVISPEGTWAYCEKLMPRGTCLKTYYGKKQGEVVFDGPVLIPSLHKSNYRTDDWTPPDEWDSAPWMSTTPMEMLSLRCGTRFAKGTTIIAGLGLGHQLIEVSKRKKVKKLILVEKSQELVDWIMPVVEPKLQMDVEVIVGCAYDVIPSMTADAALIDIFSSYGGNSFRRCPNINNVWCWGSQYPAGGDYY